MPEYLDDCVSLLAVECPALGLSDTETAEVRARGVDATIVYRPDREECQRRQDVGLEAVTRLDQLDLLMQLPTGLPVPSGSLSPSARRAVRRLPAGCVEQTTDGVVRRIVRPLDVRLTVVTGRQWKPGLVRASRFAPYCNRVLVVTGEPRNLEQAAIEADFWGIGLIAAATRAPRLVVAPERYEEYRHTPAGWAFAEDIYRQITERAVSHSSS